MVKQENVFPLRMAIGSGDAHLYLYLALLNGVPLREGDKSIFIKYATYSLGKLI